MKNLLSQRNYEYNKENRNVEIKKLDKKIWDIEIFNEASQNLETVLNLYRKEKK